VSGRAGAASSSAEAVSASTASLGEDESRAGTVAFHISHAVKLVLEEDPPGGPCLEYFLQHRILDLLASVAQRNVRTLAAVSASVLLMQFSKLWDRSDW
jgi:hypothetical protein